jgi:hypothetical protein
LQQLCCAQKTMKMFSIKMMLLLIVILCCAKVNCDKYLIMVRFNFKLYSYILFVWFDHLQLVIRGKIELECFSYNAKDEWMSCLTKKTKQKTETIVELGNIIMMSNVLCKKNHNTILIQMWNYLLIVFSIRFMLEVICWPFITSQQNWSAKVIRSGQKQCICVNESCK